LDIPTSLKQHFFALAAGFCRYAALVAKAAIESRDSCQIQNTLSLPESN
jgi:hypothetical protein